MNLIDHFKALMHEHFPDYDLSMNEVDDQLFLDSEVNAMWMMFQVCNAWNPAETMPKDENLSLLVTNKKGQVAPYIRGVIHNNVGSAWDWNYGESITGWRPLPTPPLTTEGGV